MLKRVDEAGGDEEEGQKGNEDASELQLRLLYRGGGEAEGELQLCETVGVYVGRGLVRELERFPVNSLSLVPTFPPFVVGSARLVTLLWTPFRPSTLNTSPCPLSTPPATSPKNSPVEV